MKHRMTKACSIPESVKKTVWQRDKGCCIICGNPHAAPNAHYIPRSHGGLGIEQNIVTLCAECHRSFDQSGQRKLIGSQIEEYLKGFYPDWDKEKLIYRKWEDA